MQDNGDTRQAVLSGDRPQVIEDVAVPSVDPVELADGDRRGPARADLTEFLTHQVHSPAFLRR
jgi:hypothetical protein